MKRLRMVATWLLVLAGVGAADKSGQGQAAAVQMVLVEDYEANGKKVIFKEVFGDIAPGGFTQTLYGGEAGKDLKVDQIIQATKGTRGKGK
jgi:hypothetical protein